jgi:hypothetical protein
MKVARLSALRTGHLYLQGTYLVLISVTKKTTINFPPKQKITDVKKAYVGTVF